MPNNKYVYKRRDAPTTTYTLLTNKMAGIALNPVQLSWPYLVRRFGNEEEEGSEGVGQPG